MRKIPGHLRSLCDWNGTGLGTKLIFTMEKPYRRWNSNMADTTYNYVTYIIAPQHNIIMHSPCFLFNKSFTVLLSSSFFVYWTLCQCALWRSAAKHMHLRCTIGDEHGCGPKITLLFQHLFLCPTYHVRNNYVTYTVAMRPYFSWLWQLRQLLCVATMSILPHLWVRDGCWAWEAETMIT